MKTIDGEIFYSTQDGKIFNDKLRFKMNPNGFSLSSFDIKNNKVYYALNNEKTAKILEASIESKEVFNVGNYQKISALYVD